MDAEKALAFADGDSRAGSARPGRRRGAALKVDSTPSFTVKTKATAPRTSSPSASTTCRPSSKGARDVTRAASIAVAVVGLGDRDLPDDRPLRGRRAGVRDRPRLRDRAEVRLRRSSPAIPVALLGVLGYVGILGSLIGRRRERGRTATAFLSIARPRLQRLADLRRGRELNAICIWCVGSAICMTLLAGAVVSRVCSRRLRRSSLACADHERGPGEQQRERRDRLDRRRLPERDRGDQRAPAAP